jgi:hypothetical protein
MQIRAATTGAREQSVRARTDGKSTGSVFVIVNRCDRARRLLGKTQEPKRFQRAYRRQPGGAPPSASAGNFLSLSIFNECPRV